MRRYFVSVCMGCNRAVTYYTQLIDAKNTCCVDISKHKLLKVFNSEKEARNYMERLNESREEAY